MGAHTDRWLRANEEMKHYDSQLENFTTTPLFLDLIKGKIKSIQDPKTQLFLNQQPKKITRTRTRAK